MQLVYRSDNDASDNIAATVVSTMATVNLLFLQFHYGVEISVKRLVLSS